MRIEAQRAAGRIGLKQAVAGLRNRMDNVDISQSEHALAALTQIGTTDIVPALHDMTTGDGFLKQCKAQGGSEDQCRFSEKQIRKPRFLTLTRLAPGADLAKIDKMIADEKTPELKADLTQARARVAAAAECDGKGVPCWAGKLKDPDAKVRDRAAYALLWAASGGSDEARDALVEALSDTDNEVRYAAIMGVMRRLPKDGVALADKLKAQLAAEKGKTQFIRVNEDLKRLEVRVRRGY